MTDGALLACSWRDLRATEREKRARGEVPEDTSYSSEADYSEDQMDQVAVPRFVTELPRDSSSDLEEASGSDDVESGNSCSDADSEGKNLFKPKNSIYVAPWRIQKPSFDTPTQRLPQSEV